MEENILTLIDNPLPGELREQDEIELRHHRHSINKERKKQMEESIENWLSK